MDGWLVAVLSLVAVGLPVLISFFGVCVSAGIAVLVAYLTANATISGARQHAIETERLRLRFGVYERHLNRFHELADQVEALIGRAPINEKDAWEFAINGPSMVMAVVSAAGRVMLPQHYDIALPIWGAAGKHASALAQVWEEHPELTQRPQEAADKSTAHQAGLAGALDHLRQAVDIGADARLHQDLDQPDVAQLTVLAAPYVERGGKDTKS